MSCFRSSHDKSVDELLKQDTRCCPNGPAGPLVVVESAFDGPELLRELMTHHTSSPLKKSSHAMGGWICPCPIHLCGDHERAGRGPGNPVHARDGSRMFMGEGYR